MKPTAVTLADWRAQVDKELAGVAFDKALVHATAEGLAIQPLYTESAVDPGLPGAAPFTRGSAARPAPFQVCMQVGPPAQRGPGALEAELAGGTDALWIQSDAADREPYVFAASHGLAVISDLEEPPEAERVESGPAASGAWFSTDPITGVARGLAPGPELAARIQAIGGVVERGLHRSPLQRTVRVSGLAFHDAGADAADELALMLSSGVAYLRALTDHGIAVDAAARALWVQIAIGRDTFGELCKLRALRRCWHKVLAATGAADVPPPPIHAVCASRTQSLHDPWVNMLRVTTEVFAAALGGAERITPAAFDAAFGPASDHGRRVARNTALVLREECHLGRVVDPGGGAYYIEQRSEALARAAWTQFSRIERDGGIAKLLVSGGLRARLDDAWQHRAQAIAKRKEPVLGVSEFANVDEKLPAPVPAAPAAPASPALAVHRDAEAFEAVRARIAAAPRNVVLVTLGPPAEHRGRVGFARALFATGGLRTRELAAAEASDLAGVDVACLCGSDERYAAEAVQRAGELRAAGARKIVVAGRPGALEAELRAAGVTGFVFVGCDVVATLSELIGGAA